MRRSSSSISAPCSRASRCRSSWTSAGHAVCRATRAPCSPAPRPPRCSRRRRSSSARRSRARSATSSSGSTSRKWRRACSPTSRRRSRGCVRSRARRPTRDTFLFMVAVRCCLVLAALLVALPAAAEDKEAARKAYSEGSRYYDLSQYADALEAFKRAYWNYEDPIFLFNIAQCHRLLDHKSEAISFYRSYLRKLPHARNRAEVQRVV